MSASPIPPSAERRSMTRPRAPRPTKDARAARTRATVSRAGSSERANQRIRRYPFPPERKRLSTGETTASRSSRTIVSRRSFRRIPSGTRSPGPSRVKAGKRGERSASTGSSPSRSSTSPASNPLVAAEAPGTTSKTTNRWSGARYTLKPGADSGCPVTRARMPARTCGVTSPTWAVRAARVIAMMMGQGDGAPATAASSEAPSRSGSPPHPSGSAGAGVSGREAPALRAAVPIARGSAGTMLVRTRATYARCTTRGARSSAGGEGTAPACGPDDGAASAWGSDAGAPVGVTPRPRFDAQPGGPAAASAPSSRKRGAREDIPRTLARPGGSGR